MTAKRRVTWPDVLRVVQGPKARESVVTDLRTAGFTPDSFASKQARLVVAASLTRIEDGLELTRGSNADRARTAIRDIRRRLEVEVEP